MIRALLGQVISVVYPVQNVKKWCVESGFEDQTQQIGPPQPASLLAGVGIQVGALVQRHIFGVLAFAEFNVSHHHQRRAGDKNQLQRPQTDVGDWEDVVIADVGAARLETKWKILFKQVSAIVFCFYDQDFSNWKKKYMNIYIWAIV